MDATTPHPAPARPLPPTVEESRLTSPLVRRILRESGFDGPVRELEDELGAVGSPAEAFALVRATGSALWDRAVARAQGRLVDGGLDRYDDRPLYWARTAVSSALRTREIAAIATQHQRFALLHVLDRTARGIDRPLWPTAHEGDLRVAISGFDPYSLDADVRHSNPSGAAALQLDGTRIGSAVVRSVLLPVNYGDFDQGIVEDAFGPALQAGADLITTLSMTARGRMDVEKWAANARGGTPDNNRAQHFGPVSRPARWPGDAPDWIETTLPHQAMVDAGTGPWPVVLRRGVREWPSGAFPDPAALRTNPDPSPGSTPAAGTGGDYLSNESMYRSNRLRRALGREVPGGHLHVSALIDPLEPTSITDAAFEADRRAVVDQTIALVAAAVATLR